MANVGLREVYGSPPLCLQVGAMRTTPTKDAIAPRSAAGASAPSCCQRPTPQKGVRPVQSTEADSHVCMWEKLSWLATHQHTPVSLSLS